MARPKISAETRDKAIDLLMRGCSINFTAAALGTGNGTIAEIAKILPDRPKRMTQVEIAAKALCCVRTIQRVAREQRLEQEDPEWLGITKGDIMRAAREERRSEKAATKTEKAAE
jgi:hypothetical protein